MAIYLYISYFLFVLYFIIRVLKDKFLTQRQKTNYTFVLILFPFIGVIIYLFNSKKTNNFIRKKI